MRAGMILDILGPLGNGFPKKSKKAILIGGGIGIPPMLELAKELECEKQIVLGYRDELFLTEEFEKSRRNLSRNRRWKYGNKRNRFRCDPCQ